MTSAIRPPRSTGPGRSSGAAPVGEMRPFDLAGPLPNGLTVLEASAGTGKTFTIAGLAARYVAEGVASLDQLLVVTFTRAATGELRDRVRQRLADTEGQLRRVLEGGPVGNDPVVAALAVGSPDRIETRRRRLDDAVAEFDRATITTTHGFCQHMLASLGTAGDVDRVSVFSEEVDDLIGEVVDDLYVRMYVNKDVTPPFGPAEARRLVAAAVRNPGTELEPTDAPRDSDIDLRVRLVRKAREIVEARKLAQGQLTYDDLLTRLQSTLADEQRGPDAQARLRARFRVALVDEFQDTDPIQWDILRRTFVHPGWTLVLIGDPKQAIYSFRGADVWSYLQAAEQADDEATLAVNWRTDEGLLAGIDALLRDKTLGHPRIAYRHVDATPAHRQPGLEGAQAPPLRFRVVRRADREVNLVDDGRGAGYARKPQARDLIARDVAVETAGLLARRPELVERDDEGTVTRRRALEPSDVAVLVSTNREASLVHDALAAVGVPAVLTGAGSVFATEPAHHWLRLLEALERPSSAGRARAAALTPFLGWSPARVAAGDDDELAALQAHLHTWAALLSRSGVAALFEHVSTAQGVPARLLGRPDGERDLTDLRHIGELLHAEAVTGRLGSPALAGWLRRRISEAGGGAAAEERSRRLESDADAVAVLTVHRAKGLEWPVVYLPYLWSTPFENNPIPTFYDPALNRRVLDVQGEHSRNLSRYTDERRSEELRLAYVALTRARNQVTAWWVASSDSRYSSLGRLLLGKPSAAGGIGGLRSVNDREIIERIEALADLAPGCVGVEAVRTRPLAPAEPPPAPDDPLAVRPFTRTLDTAWQRTSYTALTAAAEHTAGPPARVSTEPETSARADEPAVAVAATVPGPAADGMASWHDVPSLLSDVVAGPVLGTLVHAVLELTDFTAQDLEGELARHLAGVAGRVAPALARDPALVRELIPGLCRMLETPLGRLLGGLRLRDLRTGDRRNELDFELPLAPDATRGATLAAVAAVIERWLPPDDPLAAYPARLRALESEAELRGYLTGSIDLLARHGDRFVIVDYKTNRLAPRGEPLTAWHYRPEAMAAAMLDAHYPLQALLYAVATHRFLRGRLAGYNPATNLGGVGYLFVRGMVGADAPAAGDAVSGVFAWRPPAELVVELSDLLASGSRQGETGRRGSDARV